MLYAQVNVYEYGALGAIIFFLVTIGPVALRMLWNKLIAMEESHRRDRLEWIEAFKREREDMRLAYEKSLALCREDRRIMETRLVDSMNRLIDSINELHLFVKTQARLMKDEMYESRLYRGDPRNEQTESKDHNIHREQEDIREEQQKQAEDRTPGCPYLTEPDPYPSDPQKGGESGEAID